MRNLQQKPWLNEDGSIKSDEELKKICPNWPPSVWREYLATYEVGRREEYVLSPSEMDTFSAEECAGLLFSMAREEKNHLLKVALNACIFELPPRQRDAIVSYYWEGKTITEIAADTGTSKQAVSRIIKKALLRLKSSLTSGSIQKRVRAAQEILAS